MEEARGIGKKLPVPGIDHDEFFESATFLRIVIFLYELDMKR